DTKVPNIHIIHMEKGKQGVHFERIKVVEEAGTIGKSHEGTKVQVFKLGVKSSVAFQYGEVPVEFDVAEVSFKGRKPQVEVAAFKFGFEPPAIVFGEPWVIKEGITVTGQLKLAGEV